MRKHTAFVIVALVLGGLGFLLATAALGRESGATAPPASRAAIAGQAQAASPQDYVLTTFDGNVQQRDTNITFSNSGQDVAFATGTIVGRVVCYGDAHQAGVAGALVAINGTSMGTTSTADGTFTLANVPTGIYWRVTAVGTTSDYGAYAYRVPEFGDLANISIAEGATRDVGTLYLFCS